MNLKQRAQQHGAAAAALLASSGAGSRSRQSQGQQDDSGNRQQAPINLFRGTTVYGIVDDQLVQVLGLTDIPGMSLAWICVDPDTGDNAPVPYHEARVFPTLTKAAIQSLIDATTRR